MLSVGPTASWYVLPRESVIASVCATASPQPTITTFRFPAACAAGYATVTAVCGDCGTA